MHDAGLHVEDAGSGGPAVGDGERAASQRAQREDRVVVPDEQDAAAPRLPASHVRPGRAVDELGRGAEAPFDQLGDGGRRCGERGDVVRGRLDLDQAAQVVEQLGQRVA